MPKTPVRDGARALGLWVVACAIMVAGCANMTEAGRARTAAAPALGCDEKKVEVAAQRRTREGRFWFARCRGGTVRVVCGARGCSVVQRRNLRGGSEPEDE